MPITVEWDDSEKAAIRIIFESPWTWDEFESASQSVAGLVSRVDHQVCLIYDAVESTGYPSTNAISHYRKALLELSPYVKLHIGVGTISFTKKLATIILGVMGGKIEFVNTLDEARQLAADVREG